MNENRIYSYADVSFGSSSDSAEIAATALATIQTVTSITGWGLAVLGIFIALLALFGLSFIRKAVIKEAANRLDRHIQSDGFVERIQPMLANMIDQKLQDMFASIVQRGTEESREIEEFPELPTEGSNGNTTSN